MPQFRKKPVVIEAMRWTGDNPDAVIAWAGPVGSREGNDKTLAIGGPVDGQLLIETLEGTMRASPGDWIIRGVSGEIYPCKPDIFDATYEPAG